MSAYVEYMSYYSKANVEERYARWQKEYEKGRMVFHDGMWNFVLPFSEGNVYLAVFGFEPEVKQKQRTTITRHISESIGEYKNRITNGITDAERFNNTIDMINTAEYFEVLYEYLSEMVNEEIENK